MVHGDKQRVTKVKLEEIPRINTSGREILAKALTKMDYYKEANKDGIYFTEEEIQTIEQKYKTEGILLKDVFEELRKKKWRINQNTIKHYIQIGRLPRCMETKKGISAHYPPDFIRHINLIIFFLESGRNELETLLSAIRKLGLDNTTDRELLQEHDPYNWDMDFIQTLWSGITNRLEDGISSGKIAVKKTFANNHAKQEKYMKMIGEIEGVVNKLIKKVSDLQHECEKRRSSDEDK